VTNSSALAIEACGLVKAYRTTRAVIVGGLLGDMVRCIVATFLVLGLGLAMGYRPPRRRPGGHRPRPGARAPMSTSWDRRQTPTWRRL